MGSCFNPAPSYHKIQPTYYDPLGPAKKGGQAIRNNVFGVINNSLGRSQSDSAAAAEGARTAASDPAYAAAAENARRSIAGDYLHGSPELDRMLAQMRASGQREAANTQAGIRDQYSRNGMSFSTANQQAQQAAGAAATAKANEVESQARLANYTGERQNQLAAPQQLQAAQSIPLTYLQEAAGAPYSTLAPIAQLVQGLAGQGQLVKPDILEKDSYYGSLMGATGKL